MPNKIEYDEFFQKPRRFGAIGLLIKSQTILTTDTVRYKFIALKKEHGWFERAAYYHVGAPKTINQ